MKTRTTVPLSEDTLRAVKLRAAREGKRESEVIDQALRRDLGLDLDPNVLISAALSKTGAPARLVLESMRGSAAARGAMLVTGDFDLLELRERAPIRSPREALGTIAETFHA